MGCFLGCFGSSKDEEKRRKQGRNKVQPRDHQRFVSCKPVQSAVSQGAPEDTINNSVSQVLNEPEKELSFRARKKVTFDSNVKTYEHISCDEALDSSMGEAGGKEEGEKENLEKSNQLREEDLAKSNQSTFSEDSSITSSSGSFPPNHRYQNCRDSDDEYEGLDYEDSDPDDDNEVEDEDDDDRVVEENGLFDSDDGIVESRTISATHMFSEEFDRSCGLHDEVRSFVSNPHARDRSLYVHPVLNPVENLTQWKAVKTKGTTPLRPLKENLVSNQEPSVGSEPAFQELSFSFKSKMDKTKTPNREIAVDASLSNWLVSSETTPIKKTSTVGLHSMTSGKSMSQGSNTLRSPDDRPILGALTVEELKQFSASTSPRKSPSRSPDETPIIGTVGTYWNHTIRAEDSGSVSSFKGVPNTTSKYREDKRVNWHSTPFETRLDRALNRGAG